MDSKLLKKVLWLMLSIYLLWGVAPVPGEAADNLQKYNDKSGYFSLTPPPGWVEKDYPDKNVGRVRFTSPDRKATLSIIVMPAPPQEATFDKMLAAKQQIVEKMRREKPEGQYRLSQGTICQFKCVRFDVAFPGQIIQENYLFLEKGLSVSFGYAAAEQASLEKYRQIAVDSFCTIKLKGKE